MNRAQEGNHRPAAEGLRNRGAWRTRLSGLLDGTGCRMRAPGIRPAGRGSGPWPRTVFPMTAANERSDPRGVAFDGVLLRGFRRSIRRANGDGSCMQRVYPRRVRGRPSRSTSPDAMRPIDKESRHNPLRVGRAFPARNNRGIPHVPLPPGLQGSAEQTRRTAPCERSSRIAGRGPTRNPPRRIQ